MTSLKDQIIAKRDEIKAFMALSSTRSAFERLDKLGELYYLGKSTNEEKVEFDFLAITLPNCSIIEELESMLLQLD